jgi:hypothetical protein
MFSARSDVHEEMFSARSYVHEERFSEYQNVNGETFSAGSFMCLKKGSVKKPIYCTVKLGMIQCRNMSIVHDVSSKWWKLLKMQYSIILHSKPPPRISLCGVVTKIL